MSFARVIDFEYKPGSLDVSLQKVKASLLPIFQKSPGFLSYFIVREKGDQGVSIGIWQTREQAESATREATLWLRDNVGEIAIRLDAYVGEIILGYEVSAADRAVIEAIYDAFNSKDIARIAGLAEPGAKVTNVNFGNVEVPIRDNFQMWATAFPDGRITVNRFIISDDGVVCEFTGSGTQTGSLWTPTGTIPPTNRRAEATFVEIYKLRNGKVASCRVYFDPISLMRQLGVAGETWIPKGKAEAPRPETRH